MQSAKPLPLVAALLRCWLPAATAFGMTVAAGCDGGSAVRWCGALYAMAGALAVYSADRIGDPRMPPAAGRVLVWAACCGVVGAAGLLSGAGLHSWLIALAAGSLGLLHRWSRRWFPKNVIVAAAWTAVVLDAAGITRPSICQMVTSGLTIWSACLLCDLTDDASDDRDGTVTIARLVGRRGRRWAACAGLVLAVGIAHLGRLPLLTATAAAVLPLALVPSLAANPLYGSVVVDGVLAVPGITAALCLALT